MSALTYQPALSSPQRATNALDTLKAEWTKLRTLRATWYTVGGATFAAIGLAALICFAQVSQWSSMSAKQLAQFDATSTALLSVMFAAVILGTLAVRAITSEYSTGLIRVTFSAIPGRRAVLASKAAILAALTFPVALVINFSSVFLAQLIIGTHASLSLSQPGVLRAIVLGALAVSVVSVLALGLGGIIRKTSGATTALMLLIIGSGLFGIALPASARQYLPGNALQAIVSTKHIDGVLSAGRGFGVLALYAVVALAVAARLISSRDA